jgi:hypothetical protein
LEHLGEKDYPNAKVSLKNNPFHLKELTYAEFSKLLRGTFDDVRFFGQDLIKKIKEYAKNGGCLLMKSPTRI